MPTHYRGSAPEVRALNAFIKLLRSTETLAAKLHEGLGQHELTLGQLAVLEALLHLGPMSQRDLGRKLLRSNANVSTVVDNLEKAALVQRERSSDDRRVVNVTLTRSGRTLIQKVFPSHADRITELMSVLTPDEQDQLGALCKKLGLGACKA